MIDLVNDDDFTFWVPMEIMKAAGTEVNKEKDQDKNVKRLIQGIASTVNEDLQKEFVDQSGIDFSYFLKYGYYNNDHKPGFDNKVGQPLECKVTKEGLWTKGFLFKDHKIADSIWELANALEASQSNRKLGFSIQGKVLRRNGKRILACWVQDIAITTAPINTNTWLDVVKSLAMVPSDLWFSDQEKFSISPRLVSPVAKSTCDFCRKNMQQKNSIDESQMDLKKKEEDEDNKSLDSNSPVAKVESLEGNIKDQLWGGIQNKIKKSNNSNELDYNECIDLLKNYRNLSVSDAEIIVDTIFTMNGL